MGEASSEFSLWPKSFKDYLERKFDSALTLSAYILDPEKLELPKEDHRARPQKLPKLPQSVKNYPFAGLIYIREIRAQRGFDDASESSQQDRNDSLGKKASAKNRKLSSQLRAYYHRHLDPSIDPSEEDILALSAVHTAQSTFDDRLKSAFKSAKKELEQLGYPGVSNPKLLISTRIRPTEGLDHSSAVQYDIGGNDEGTRLPENYSGLGFQNLISMVFHLMRFRDGWMRVGKLSSASATDNKSGIEPLQLILVEEPEAHLHAQVQQVFIRKAYAVLRNHRDLDGNASFHSQLIVSTHSSHIAHELDFSDIRYFKRQPATVSDVPTSVVANLSNVFGKDDETTRFVRRYLKTTHCDLLFADGVILVEGAAERILLPHLIQKRFPDLAHRYISLLELGGSHAHRLKPLIDLLSIPTLIITDLDAVDPNNSRKAVRPQRDMEYVTSNPVLKLWLPQQTKIDDLLDQKYPVQTIVGNGYGIVGAVYQRGCSVTYPMHSATRTLIPSTFEDALTLANPDMIKNLSGGAMTNAFATIMKEGSDSEQIAQELYDCLRKSPGKAAFTLDLLISINLDELIPPPYIDDGLSWLQEQLNKVTEIG